MGRKEDRRAEKKEEQRQKEHDRSAKSDKEREELRKILKPDIEDDDK
jgi:hypothetical protein